MRAEDGQVGEAAVDLLGHGDVGQQHELLNQLVALPTIVQTVALEKREID